VPVAATARGERAAAPLGGESASFSWFLTVYFVPYRCCFHKIRRRTGVAGPTTALWQCQRPWRDGCDPGLYTPFRANRAAEAHRFFIFFDIPPARPGPPLGGVGSDHAAARPPPTGSAGASPSPGHRPLGAWSAPGPPLGGVGSDRGAPPSEPRTPVRRPGPLLAERVRIAPRRPLSSRSRACKGAEFQQ
jgi:hypothetical protein